MSIPDHTMLLATHNQHKVAEIRALLRSHELDVHLESLADMNELGEVREDGRTFAENAAKKALFTGVRTDRLTLADDSGLEVDFLGGLPGVRSSRYAGEGATDEANNIKLLTALREVPEKERTARFRSVVAVFVPGADAEEASWELDDFWADALEGGELQRLDNELLTSGEPRHWKTPWGEVALVTGACEGFITSEPRGNRGFGYDPLFYYPELGMTFGELPAKAKNRHSHRARALAKAAVVLADLFQ